MSSDNDIRKQFQGKLNDYKAGVPEDGWERLEEALNAAPVVLAPRRRWRYAASSAAAVLLLIVGSLLWVQRPREQAGPMLTDSAGSTPLTTRPSVSTIEPHRGESDIHHDEPGDASRPVATRAAADELFAAKASGTADGSAIRITPAPEFLASSSLSLRERIHKAVSEIDARSLNEMMAPVGREAHAGRAEETLFAGRSHEGVLVKHERQGEREPITLALSGRGGLTSYQQTVNTPMTLRGASAATNQSGEGTKNLFATQSTADNISEMEHDQPVSFGITVSKAIVDNLYIETGLVYSYLYSKSRNASANFKVHETQRLHYIGVPLNVNYNVLSLSRLNVYASVGGMIEKDIRGDFRKIGAGELTDFNSRSEEVKVTEISQRNPQVSVNAGIGISYPVYNRLRLYGKIGGSYYFDARNEYKTIYSDRKIVMDLNVGLRYEF